MAGTYYEMTSNRSDQVNYNLDLRERLRTVWWEEIEDDVKALEMSNSSASCKDRSECTKITSATKTGNKL